MSYSAYEVTAGSSAIQMVEAFQRTRTANGTFGTATIPTLTQVETFLTRGKAELAAVLEKHGYSKTQTDADVLGVLEPLNVKAACYYVELTSPTAGYTSEGEPVGRLSSFRAWRKEAAELCTGRTLADLGATRTYEKSSGLSAGGISISDKETIEEDSDYEPLAFTRGLHEAPGDITDQEAE